MSLGDTIIMCHAGEAVPCECMLTSNSNTHVVHIEVCPRAVCIHTEKITMFTYSVTNSKFLCVLGVFSYIHLYLKVKFLNLMLGVRSASFTLYS